MTAHPTPRHRFAVRGPHRSRGVDVRSPVWRILLAPVLALLGVLGPIGSLSTAHAESPNATALRARHAELRDQLANNQFNRPLFIESTQTAGDLKGDVYAIVDQPYAVVSRELRTMEQWCDVLMLHLNVKNCQANRGSQGETLTLSVGRKFDQPVDDAYRVDFAYRLVSAQSDFLQVVLNADEGPLGTKNYRIVFEAVPLDGKQSFVHMSYSYAYGFAARMAMQGYLSTVGRDKVGFSIVGKNADGSPQYMNNVRGVVERNTMRYYLAIEAYLATTNQPPGEQAEKRLEAWYSAVERYPLQLHELEHTDYMAMKRRELARQREYAVSAPK